MMTPEQEKLRDKIANETQNLAYKLLFGKTKSEFLILGHKRPDFNIGQWEDMTEGLMDCMSIEALAAISFVNSIVAKTLMAMPIDALRMCSPEQKIELMAYCVRESAQHYLKTKGYKKGRFIPFWIEDSKEGK